jgi:hypothetical protein
VKRKLTVVALIAVAAVVLFFILPTFGLRPADLLSECGRARFEATIGFNVPLCTCGNCTEPMPLPLSPEPR